MPYIVTNLTNKTYGAGGDNILPHEVYSVEDLDADILNLVSQGIFSVSSYVAPAIPSMKENLAKEAFKKASTLANISPLPVDANGNVLANIIPRTGTLTSLQTTPGGVNEISEATDYPYLVKHDGTTSGSRAIAFKTRAKVMNTKATIISDADFIKLNWTVDGTEVVAVPPALNISVDGTTFLNGVIYDKFIAVDGNNNVFEVGYYSSRWFWRIIGNVQSTVAPTTFASGSFAQTDTYGQSNLFGNLATSFGEGDFVIGSTDQILQSQVAQINKSFLRGSVSSAASVELTTSGAAPIAANALTFAVGTPFSLMELTYTLMVADLSKAGSYYIARTTTSALYQYDVNGAILTQILAPTVVTTNVGLTLTSSPTFVFNSSGKLVITVPKASVGTPALTCLCMIETKILFA